MVISDTGSHLQLQCSSQNISLATSMKTPLWPFSAVLPLSTTSSLSFSLSPSSSSSSSSSPSSSYHHHHHYQMKIIAWCPCSWSSGASPRQDPCLLTRSKSDNNCHPSFWNHHNRKFDILLDCYRPKSSKHGSDALVCCLMTQSLQILMFPRVS